MKKIAIILFVIIFSACTPIFSDSFKLNNFEPYTVEEFPEWSIKARRAESIFFGSLALTMPVSLLSYTVVGKTGIISTSNDDMTNLMYQVSFAAALSLGITLTDYILGELE
ncbi:MAG: hypothetical protein JJE21_00880 [Spirochaetaceae bacterium]|nr:hypothetical protein [Spirochaetaceae bacterium]